MSETETESEKEQVHEFQSEKGKKMAASIAEFIFMRFFFPQVRDKRKFAIIKQ